MNRYDLRLSHDTFCKNAVKPFLGRFYYCHYCVTVIAQWPHGHNVAFGSL